MPINPPTAVLRLLERHSIPALKQAVQQALEIGATISTLRFCTEDISRPLTQRLVQINQSPGLVPVDHSSSPAEPLTPSPRAPSTNPAPHFSPARRYIFSLMSTS